MPALETPRGQTPTIQASVYPTYVDVRTNRVVYSGFDNGSSTDLAPSIPLDVTMPYGPLESTGGTVTTAELGINTESITTEPHAPVSPAPLPIDTSNELNELHNLRTMLVHGGVYLHPTTYTVHLFASCSSITGLPLNRQAINCNICGNCRRRRDVTSAIRQAERFYG